MSPAPGHEWGPVQGWGPPPTPAAPGGSVSDNDEDKYMEKDVDENKVLLKDS